MYDILNFSWVSFCLGWWRKWIYGYLEFNLFGFFGFGFFGFPFFSEGNNDNTINKMKKIEFCIS